MRSRRALTAVIAGAALLGASVALGPPAQAGSGTDRADPCYFVVTVPAGSSGAPVLPASVRTRIAACADAMQDGFTRTVIRVGRKPSARDRAWQAAILREFVRNGCTDITSTDDVEGECLVFGEKWPYGYAGKVAKPGTVVVLGFEPI